ncbi:DUF4124 domain-containing protein [Kushneria phosphatilytica]|uniref:DUF4124 domain-containing protein n=1 Tax=Kushneria phosphatilytica TaxID=657387 RepID=UPI00143A4A3D|nr:DUF4124 domain-containing protein [Kushneria phosphatilytica]
MKGFGWVLALWLMAGTASAESALYRQVDEQGRVHWSDLPQGERHTLPTPSVIHLDAPSGQHVIRTPVSSCQRLTLVLPAPERPIALAEAASGIALRVECLPSLSDPLRVQLRVDGQLSQSPLHTTVFLLPGLAPGRHRLQAELVDREGRIRRSSPVLSVQVVESPSDVCTSECQRASRDAQ